MEKEPSFELLGLADSCVCNEFNPVFSKFSIISSSLLPHEGVRDVPVSIPCLDTLFTLFTEPRVQNQGSYQNEQVSENRELT